MYQPWYDDIISKELYDLKDQQITQNVDSDELQKLKKNQRLRAKFKKKKEYLKAESAKINHSARTR